MLNLNHLRKIVTLEPILDFDVKVLVSWIKEINPEVVYVGYDSHPKNNLPEPPKLKVESFISKLKELGIKVRIKEFRKAWWED